MSKLFIAIIAIIFGGILEIVGIALLAIKSSKKDKYMVSYKKLELTGILCFVFGSLMISVPICYGLIFGGGENVENSPYSSAVESEYYSTYVETKETLSSTYSDILSDRAIEWNGKKYIEIFGMTHLYQDEYRKDGVTNSAVDATEGQFTVFRYEHPSGCDMLCMRDLIYCAEEDISSLENYYRQGPFVYKVYSMLDNEYLTENAEIPDVMFFELFDLNTQKLSAYSQTDYDWKMYKNGTAQYYKIEQYSEDERFCREVEIDISSKQEVFLRNISSSYANEGNRMQGGVYLVGDPILQKQLIDLEKQKNEFEW